MYNGTRITRTPLRRRTVFFIALRFRLPVNSSHDQLVTCDELTFSFYTARDELTFWRVDRVTSWSCDELTGSRDFSNTSSKDKKAKKLSLFIAQYVCIVSVIAVFSVFVATKVREALSKAASHLSVCLSLVPISKRWVVEVCLLQNTNKKPCWESNSPALSSWPCGHWLP